MCGIFGWISNASSNVSKQEYIKGLEELFLLSESRGKEASGVCFASANEVSVYKECIRAKQLIHTEEYRRIINKIHDQQSHLIMGHARMVTNGSKSKPENNQPVVRGDLICIHNGIIVNDKEIWGRHPELFRNAEVDTEILLALLESNEYRKDLVGALQHSAAEIEGTMSIALLNRNSSYMLLYTNTGSLYTLRSNDGDMLLFASEKYILKQMVLKRHLEKWFSVKRIRQMSPRTGVVIDIDTCRVKKFSLESVCPHLALPLKEKKFSLLSGKQEKNEDIPMMRPKSRLAQVEALLQVDEKKIASLRRCSRCLLPETFPGITFDESGVCSVCRAYVPKKLKGVEMLRADLERKRGDSISDYDCIIPLSGGRDSCYMLHYMVKEMGMHPVAYTYDWGMVTDLARRNIQRMCAALEVEHILISADIAKKRKNIQLNVNAWLKHPKLATVPLFMAGDKHFFYYAQMLKKQMNVANIIFGMNSLEETKFKAGFAGIKKPGKNGLYYNLTNKNKLNLFAAYGKEFMKNPAYLNRSLVDSFAGFASYYLIPKDFIQIFDYIPWKQEVVENVILNQYNWERAEDSNETWRIGDGTAPFYNYIYYRMAGFSEFDTFKSNQIREGMIDRETALSTLSECNRVSPEGFIWYCDAIHVDPVDALKIINRQRTLYDNL